MATVTFEVPDDIKEAFERTLRGENTSELIAGFMRGAVEKAQRRQRSREAIANLSALREEIEPVTAEQVYSAREELRQ